MSVDDNIPIEAGRGSVQQVLDVQNPLTIATGDSTIWDTPVHKFGRNAAVATTYVPICTGGIYQMVQPAAATTLRIAAGGSANDDAAGSHAREITIEGLDENGAFATETIATAGASASGVTSATFIRLFRAFVSDSGTYATAAAGSQAADITIENGGGGTTWMTITVADYPRSQSQFGCYSVPDTKTAWIKTVLVSIEGTKVVDVALFVRENLVDDAAGYQAMRIKQELVGLENITRFNPYTPPGGYVGPCDIIWMAKGTAPPPDVSIDFEILLKDTV